MKFTTTFVALAALTSYASATRVQWFTHKGCNGVASIFDYRNVPCNTCVDPPGGTFL